MTGFGGDGGCWVGCGFFVVGGGSGRSDVVGGEGSCVVAGGFGSFEGEGSPVSGGAGVCGGAGAGAARGSRAACRLSRTISRSRGRASAVFVHAGDVASATRATIAREW